MSKIDILNQCINCGLCSSVCPTYLVSRDEYLSPRGRLLLLQEYINDSDMDIADLADTFSNCLACGACKTGCPLNVDTTTLLNWGMKLTDCIPKIDREYVGMFVKDNIDFLKGSKLANIESLQKNLRKLDVFDAEYDILYNLLQKAIGNIQLEKVNNKVCFLKAKIDLHQKNINSDTWSSLFAPFFMDCCDVEDTGIGIRGSKYYYGKDAYIANELLERCTNNIISVNPDLIVLTSPFIDIKVIKALKHLQFKVYTLSEFLDEMISTK
ncbi:4Fe-4S dicluster domain-containing protein [Bacillus pseudomycoides]|uniref:4Fe-4S dicluster domain-containing protein n=1 Tax=Bacillus pseudomycoides TaxID=64104 RepID=UPI001FB50FBF|nr:(Fe-S)-binding protein [Bacillus pseudomycoides]